MAEADQSFILSVPRTFTERARDLMADEVIDHIRSRTKKGLGINNTPFKKYSDAYKSTIEFTASGKDNTVDLTLTDDMLSSLVLKASGVGFIKIGLSDTFANDKAAWNKQRGREFMGISIKDASTIANRVKGVFSNE